jgi:hypothetical protein
MKAVIVMVCAGLGVVCPRHALGGLRAALCGRHVRVMRRASGREGGRSLGRINVDFAVSSARGRRRNR